MVAVIGYGFTRISEHWDKSLRELACESIQAALMNANMEKPEALFVGNMSGATVSGQQHLGALIADWCGFSGIEAYTIEAADASGAAAFRSAFLAIASGFIDTAVVCGVEQMTDVLPDYMTFATSLGSDYDYEVSCGITQTSLFALIARMYMQEFGAMREDLGMFAINSHRNAVANPFAIYRKEINIDTLLKSPMACDPLSVFDCSPVCDGSASVVLCSEKALKTNRAVRVIGSSVATDTMMIATRKDPLYLKSANDSSKRAYAMAKKKPEDIGLFELFDAYTILAAMQLEACGFANRGEGYLLARNNEIGIRGKIPICTMGGLKARGNPIGATGVYQIAEVTQQLLEEAGKNQVTCTTGMAQSIGGPGSTAVTHILEAV